MNLPKMNRDLGETKRRVMSGQIVRTPWNRISITTRGTLIQPISVPNESQSNQQATTSTPRWA